jgi:hypothetical protein
MAVKFLLEQNQELREQRAGLTKELEAQARLNGMGSEREAKLMAELESVRRERHDAIIELNSARSGNSQLRIELQRAENERLRDLVDDILTCYRYAGRGDYAWDLAELELLRDKLGQALAGNNPVTDCGVDPAKSQLKENGTQLKATVEGMHDAITKENA